MEWIKLTWIKNSEIYKRLGISAGLFSQKLNNKKYNRFLPHEIEKIEEIRKEFIMELLK